jgi:UPF0716 family protein affecting phage T7 exclusion
VALVAAGLLLIDPGVATDFVGAGLAIFVAAIQFASRKSALAPSPKVAPGQ